MGVSDLTVYCLILSLLHSVAFSQGRNGCPSSVMVFVLKAPSLLWAPLPVGEAAEASGQ